MILGCPQYPKTKSTCKLWHLMDQNRVVKSAINNCFHHTFSPSKLQIVDQFSYYLEIHVLIKKNQEWSFNYVVYF
jgi:hypothetical protein